MRSILLLLLGVPIPIVISHRTSESLTVQAGGDSWGGARAVRRHQNDSTIGVPRWLTKKS